MCIFERHLKKGSIFISTKGERVYLFNGIIDSWEDMLSGVPTPIIVDAVLLPFKDCIITDGRSLSMLYCSPSKTALLPMGWYQ